MKDRGLISVKFVFVFVVYELYSMYLPYRIPLGKDMTICSISSLGVSLPQLQSSLKGQTHEIFDIPDEFQSAFHYD